MQSVTGKIHHHVKAIEQIGADDRTDARRGQRGERVGQLPGIRKKVLVADTEVVDEHPDLEPAVNRMKILHHTRVLVAQQQRLGDVGYRRPGLYQGSARYFINTDINTRDPANKRQWHTGALGHARMVLHRHHGGPDHDVPRRGHRAVQT